MINRKLVVVAAMMFASAGAVGCSAGSASDGADEVSQSQEGSLGATVESARSWGYGRGEHGRGRGRGEREHGRRGEREHGRRGERGWFARHFGW